MHLSHLVTLGNDANWLRVHSLEHNKGGDSLGLWGCDTRPAGINTCPQSRLKMIITSSFRKSLGFGEAEEGPKESETHKHLPLLQSLQEVWKGQHFLIRFPQRSQFDRRQRSSPSRISLMSWNQGKGKQLVSWLVASGFVYVGLRRRFRSLQARGGNLPSEYLSKFQ